MAARDYSFQRLQILTVADLLAGKKPGMPPAYGTFKQAGRAGAEGGARQAGLFDQEGNAHD